MQPYDPNHYRFARKQPEALRHVPWKGTVIKGEAKTDNEFRAFAKRALLPAILVWVAIALLIAWAIR